MQICLRVPTDTGHCVRLAWKCLKEQERSSLSVKGEYLFFCVVVVYEETFQ